MKFDRMFWNSERLYEHDFETNNTAQLDIPSLRMKQYALYDTIQSNYLYL